jgi:hypothetical protein
MRRYLSVYEKNGDNLINRIELRNIDNNQLRNIIGDQRNDPDFRHSYELDKKKLEGLKQFINIPIDTSKFEYFLETFSG